MSAADIDALAERVLMLAALRTRVAELEKVAKAALAQAIPPGSNVKPLIGGEPAGTVSRTVNTTVASVADEDAFAGWIERVYPQAVEYRLVVNPAVLNSVLTMSKEAGIPVGPGGECGENGPAGIRVTIGAGSVRALPNKDRMAALWQRIRERLPELTAGDAE